MLRDYLKGSVYVIKVTNINGVEYYLNCEKIEMIEMIPDTLITLRDGKKYYVRETPEELVEKIIEYKKRIFVDLPLINNRQITETDV